MRNAARLLLVLALLLPFRGALAAAGTFCHEADAPPTAAAHVHAHHDHAVDAVPAAHDVAHALPAVPDSGASSAGACTVCCPSCSAPGLPVASDGLHVIHPAGAERFPALPIERAAVLSGRLERPPRTS